MRVLIVHASRHGATAGIAKRIGEVIAAEGIDVLVTPAVQMRSPSEFDACLVGAGVYMGSWVKEGVEFLERYASLLADRPVWLFSSGPLKGSTKEAAGPVDPVENALGPADGPGSGGRKKIAALSDRIRPRDHRVFYGAYDPTDPPKTMAERFVRILPAAKGILPPGDFREWSAIEDWAREIARALSPVPVG